MTQFAAIIAQNVQQPIKKVEQVLQLLAEGSTIPFIARYRKEVTGAMDEVVLAEIKTLNSKYEELEKRRQVIIDSITEQGKITPELLRRLTEVMDLSVLEDIYLPFKPKRKTRATMAIEKGLEPLASLIFSQKEDRILEKAKAFINKDVPDIKAAITGAQDIMAEWISENLNTRASVRKQFEKGAVIYSKIKKNKALEAQKFQDYFEFDEPLAKIPSHRLLAILRGAEEGFLQVAISPDSEKAVETIEFQYLKGLPEPKKIVKEAILDSYNRLIKPSIENEFFGTAKEKADIEAIKIFSENLKQLLLSSPLGQKIVLGIDPGFRTGCKTVVIDANANLIHDTVIYPHNGNNELLKAAEIISNLTTKYNVVAIAIGNGTAGRETESFVRSLNLPNVAIYMVSEQGASIYSASAVAREEFPKQDITVRGAVSIARRLMDPLAELVKIDAKSIGVGQYQHDVDQKMLKESLDQVVVSCVNKVGVNINTASKHLLAYVSGLGPVLAKNIVEYRAEKGNFKSKAEIKKVPRLGEKAFEQCAGFLRIKNGKNPLDSTAVHPESYFVVEKMANNLGCTVPDLISNKEIRSKIVLEKYQTATLGLHTLKDIVQELEKPGLDPREALQEFAFDASVKKMEDLEIGQKLPGIVTNITAFGAFVDIGVKQDGLIHISQMGDKFIKDPNEVLKLHQRVLAKVVEVDIARKRIALSLKNV